MGGVQLKDQPKLIGTCGLFRWDKRWKRCTTGCELTRTFHGQGIMREALTGILHWGFRDTDLNRVEAQIHPESGPSVKHLIFGVTVYCERSATGVVGIMTCCSTLFFGATSSQPPSTAPLRASKPKET